MARKRESTIKGFPILRRAQSGSRDWVSSNVQVVSLGPSRAQSGRYCAE